MTERLEGSLKVILTVINCYPNWGGGRREYSRLPGVCDHGMTRAEWGGVDLGPSGAFGTLGKVPTLPEDTLHFGGALSTVGGLRLAVGFRLSTMGWLRRPGLTVLLIGWWLKGWMRSIRRPENTGWGSPVGRGGGPGSCSRAVSWSRKGGRDGTGSGTDNAGDGVRREKFQKSTKV